ILVCRPEFYRKAEAFAAALRFEDRKMEVWRLAETSVARQRDFIAGFDVITHLDLVAATLQVPVHPDGTVIVLNHHAIGGIQKLAVRPALVRVIAGLHNDSAARGE